MIVVLDNIRSALNVGSIIRTCDAFGINKVYFCGITPEPGNPRVLKTSLGAEKNIDINISSSTYDTVKELKSKGNKIIGLEITKNSTEISNVKTGKDITLVVGNEVSGISEDVLGLCDILAEIPMRGVKESLNVSVAFGIAAYQLNGSTTCKD